MMRLPPERLLSSHFEYEFHIANILVLSVLVTRSNAQDKHIIQTHGILHKKTKEI